MSKAKNRPKRAPIRRRRLLEAKQRPGYVRRWVNEEAGAIEDYKYAGWAPVVGDEDITDAKTQDGKQMGSVVRRVVNRSPHAVAKHAVLMEIPEDLYNEYQAAKQMEVDKSEHAIDPKKSKIDGSDYGNMTKSYS